MKESLMKFTRMISEKSIKCMNKITEEHFIYIKKNPSNIYIFKENELN